MFIIKKFEKENIAEVLQLIKDLAEYEKAPLEVTNTAEKMLADGFGENPIFGGYVAFIEDKIVGMAIYYYRYSTWKGRVLYLEDLYIMPEYRRLGIGEAFFEYLIQHAKDTKCQRITWQVLDWNTPAVRFYEKLGANIDKGWWNGYIEL